MVACLKVAKFFFFELPFYPLKLFGVFMLDSFEIWVVHQCYGLSCHGVSQSNWNSCRRRNDDWMDREQQDLLPDPGGGRARPLP